MRSYLSWSAAFLLVAGPVPAQFPGIPRPRVELPLPSLDDLYADLIREDPPLTNTLQDIQIQVPWLDDWQPRVRGLAGLERTATGGWLLPRGATYELPLASFCLQAGTHGPSSRGEGYLSAPLRGPKAEPIRQILRNWSSHSDLP